MEKKQLIIRPKGSAKPRTPRWHLVCLSPKHEEPIYDFPFTVGRKLAESKGWQIAAASVSRKQFVLETEASRVLYRNLSQNPALINGKHRVSESLTLAEGYPYWLIFGSVLLVLGTDLEQCRRKAASLAARYYLVLGEEERFGPLSCNDLKNELKHGTLGMQATVCSLAEPDRRLPLAHLLGDAPQADEAATRIAVPANHQAQAQQAPAASAPEPAAPPAAPLPPPPPAPAHAPQGEYANPPPKAAPSGRTFRCPSCCAPLSEGELLAVAAAPELRGDALLGPLEPRRFTPTRFNEAGLPLDDALTPCPDVACPVCHLRLPQRFSTLKQCSMALIGASEAGKSTLLASAVWQCRQHLRKRFGLGFMDLDLAANRWLTAYEEHCFFQPQGEAHPPLGKTAWDDPATTRRLFLNGSARLLPSPAFFHIRPIDAPNQACALTLYDCAGEHFQTGNDRAPSAVTLPLLHASLLCFLFDPVADPRMRALLPPEARLTLGATRRQDVLLTEFAERFHRQAGTHCAEKLRQPLLFALAKADLLHAHLPEMPALYRPADGGRYVLDKAALKTLSAQTEAFLSEIIPEAVDTARDIAERVLFLPLSALTAAGRPGEQAAASAPRYAPADLPIALTLAESGLLPLR